MSRSRHTTLSRKPGSPDDDLDCEELSLLEFLTLDIEAHPERLVPIDTGLVELLEELTAEVDIDLSAPLPAEDN